MVCLIPIPQLISMTLALRVLIKRHLGPMHFAVACFFLVAISYEPLKREHTVRAASIVLHMIMKLFLIVHEIIKSFVHSIWPKSYTDYRVLFNPSSHACKMYFSGVRCLCICRHSRSRSCCEFTYRHSELVEILVIVAYISWPL